MSARLLLVGGPFNGETAFELPPDITAPAQIVWSGALGCLGHIYEHRGERTCSGGRTNFLIYRWTGRRVPPERVPYLLSEDAELWTDTCALIAETTGVPPHLIWPGL